jgi:hypothetical protein
LSAYILRPSFASTRLNYDKKTGQIEYETTKGIHRSMDVLDWIALVTSHIPNPHEQTVRYYGRYSNASRGKRRRQALGISVTQVESSGDDSASECFAQQRRRNWARLLKKVYEVDPLTCLRCGNQMEIIAFIEKGGVIRKILEYLGLWERPQRSRPQRLFPHKMETLLQSLTPRKAQQVRASSDSLFWDDVPVIEE